MPARLSMVETKASRAKVLVTGPTGKVGKHLIAALQGMAIPVRAASRHPDRVHHDVPSIRFDWNDPRTWADALDGIDMMFLVKPQVDDPSRLVGSLLTGARCLHNVVLLSEIRAEQRSDDDPHRATELVVERGKASWTILRPNWFFQNVTEGLFLRPILECGEIRMSTGGARVSFIDTRDVADVAVAVLTGEGHSGRAYTLTGPEALTVADLAAEVTRVAGRQVRHVDCTLQRVHEDLRADGVSARRTDFLMGLYRDIHSGEVAVTTNTVSEVTGHPARKFGDFIGANAAVFGLDGLTERS